MSSKVFPLAQFDKLEIWKEPKNRQINYIGEPGQSTKTMYHIMLVNARGDAVALIRSNDSLEEIRKR